MESITTDLLNDLETFLAERVNVDIDGLPNRAMILLQLLQAERETTHSTDQVPTE